jgi:hypothetical protein
VSVDGHLSASVERRSADHVQTGAVQHEVAGLGADAAKRWRLITDLAATDPCDGGTNWCFFCHEWDYHTDGCLWLRARRLTDETERGRS